MKTLTIGSIFVLLAIGSGALAQSAFADHSEATVEQPEGASLPFCAETNECFVPSDVTIDVGGTVTWINNDIALHNMASGTSEDADYGTLFGGATLLMKPSEEYSFTFDDFEPGTYPSFPLLLPTPAYEWRRNGCRSR